jgi:hypothetical protein
MILPYLIEGFEIPAPAVKVQLVNPTSKVKETGIARIDCGADITVIPFKLMEKLNLNVAGKTYTSGYDDPGKIHMLFTCTLRLRSLTFSSIDVIAALTPHILIGLDVLNSLHICLDGKKKQFEIIERRKKKRRQHSKKILNKTAPVFRASNQRRY